MARPAAAQAVALLLAGILASCGPSDDAVRARVGDIVAQFEKRGAEADREDLYEELRALGEPAARELITRYSTEDPMLLTGLLIQMRGAATGPLRAALETTHDGVARANCAVALFELGERGSRITEGILEGCERNHLFSTFLLAQVEAPEDEVRRILGLMSDFHVKSALSTVETNPLAAAPFWPHAKSLATGGRTPETRVVAIQALRAYGGDERTSSKRTEVLAVLRKLAADDDNSVAAAAKEALGALGAS